MYAWTQGAYFVYIILVYDLRRRSLLVDGGGVSKSVELGQL